MRSDSSQTSETLQLISKLREKLSVNLESHSLSQKMALIHWMRLWCRIGMTVRYAMGFFPTYLNKYAHQTGSWNPNFQGKRNKSLKVPIRISSSHDTFSSIWASWHCVYLVWCSQTQPFPRKKISTHTHTKQTCLNTTIFPTTKYSLSQRHLNG